MSAQQSSLDFNYPNSSGKSASQNNDGNQRNSSSSNNASPPPRASVSASPPTNLKATSPSGSSSSDEAGSDELASKAFMGSNSAPKVPAGSTSTDSVNASPSTGQSSGNAGSNSPQTQSAARTNQSPVQTPSSQTSSSSSPTSSVTSSVSSSQESPSVLQDKSGNTSANERKNITDEVSKANSKGSGSKANSVRSGEVKPKSAGAQQKSKNDGKSNDPTLNNLLNKLRNLKKKNKQANQSNADQAPSSNQVSNPSVAVPAANQQSTSQDSSKASTDDSKKSQPPSAGKVESSQSSTSKPTNAQSAVSTSRSQVVSSRSPTSQVQPQSSQQTSSSAQATGNSSSSISSTSNSVPGSKSGLNSNKGSNDTSSTTPTSPAVSKPKSDTAFNTANTANTASKPAPVANLSGSPSKTAQASGTVSTSVTDSAKMEPAMSDSASLGTAGSSAKARVGSSVNLAGDPKTSAVKKSSGDAKTQAELSESEDTHSVSSGKYPYTIYQLLDIVIQRDASDLHISVDYPAMLRVDGDLTPVSNEIITPEIAENLILPILEEDKRDRLEVNREVDLAYDYEGKGRFRVNAFFQRKTMAAALRLIPSKIRTIDELGLPGVYHQLTKINQGFVLVTGPTGSGKTTTLAALLQEINLNRACHILTIEDPIEYVYEPAKALIAQREVGDDTHSWQIAMKSALREDPDVVLVGEMRDYETIASAITLAETGHLVFATLHTNNAAQTIDRIIDVFPEHQQNQVRAQLSNIIEAVIAQRLVPLQSGGRTAVSEIMIANPAIRNLVREAKTHQIDNVIRTSADIGMISLEHSLVKLVRENKITMEVAQRFSVRPEEIVRLMKS